MAKAPNLERELPAAVRLRREGGAYLAANTMGLIPERARRAEARCLKAQQRDGIAVWDPGGAWGKVLARHADVIARTFGAAPELVCPLTNITDGLWRVLSCPTYRPGHDVVLTTSLCFPTQRYASFGFERFGARVHLVEADRADTAIPTERLVEAIRRERPAVVNLSHAAYRSGALVDAAAVAEACRAVDAVFLLDAAQTGFALPLSLGSTGADVLLVQQHKWGCAGTGGAALVASPGFVERFAPALTGWMSHAEIWSFRPGPVQPAPGAWRFCGGTPEVPAKARADAAARLIADDLGLERVAAHNRDLRGHLTEALAAGGLLPARQPEPGRRAVVQPEAAGPFVAVQLEDAAAAQRAVAALAARRFVVDARGDRVRVGPAFYNTREDVQAFAAALLACAR